MKRDYAMYQVALKLLLKRGNLILFLKTADDGMEDLPGGRIDNVESKVPLEKILAREVREELGPHVKYKLGKPLFQFRRLIPSRNLYNFLTVYEGTYVSGKIKLSPEHSGYEWINPKTYRLQRKNFFNNQEEYNAFKKYFGNYSEDK
jgi:8-oxo-dGTP pyrophosphatase MutT (NUDIX family)